MKRIVFNNREVVITDLESAYDYLELMSLKYETYLKYLEHRGTSYYARQIFYETEYDLDNLWKDVSIELDYELDIEKFEYLNNKEFKEQLENLIKAINKKLEEVSKELDKMIN